MADIFRGCTACNSIQVLSNNFISFTADQFNGGNMLRWQMENTNTANGLFDIESSADGYHFQTIHLLAAGQDNSTKNYSYLAPALFTEQGYYRVKYTDSLSKLIIYSPIIKVKRKQFAAIAIYPNPFTDQLLVSLAGKYSSVTAVVANMYGKVISSQQLSPPGNTWTIKLPPHCSAGIYVVTITAGEHSWPYKVIKQ